MQNYGQRTKAEKIIRQTESNQICLELYNLVLFLKNVLRFSRICFRHSEEGSARRENTASKREQKPSLAWIMPSRSRENPTLCRISLKTNAHNDVLRHDIV